MLIDGIAYDTPSKRYNNYPIRECLFFSSLKKEVTNKAHYISVYNQAQAQLAYRQL